RVRIAAIAAAEATRLSAEASAAEGRIALDQAIIDQLPELVRAAGAGLAGANLTVLNGAEGVNQAAASIAGQGIAILRSLTEGLPGGPRGTGTSAADQIG
ncbi:MAG: flotillin, partial [Angustibacter sp.]